MNKTIEYTVSYFFRVDGQNHKGEMLVMANNQKDALSTVKRQLSSEFNIPEGRIKVSLK